MANPIVSAEFKKILVEGLREVAEDKFANLTSPLMPYYRVIDSQSAWEEFYSITGVGDIPAFNGRFQLGAIYPGFNVVIEPSQFGLMLEFERTLLEDKKYGVMQDRTGMLVDAAIRTRDKMSVEPFTYAFSAAYRFMPTYEEAVALCSSSHTTKTGVSTSSGFSNAGTSVLNKTNVAATRLAMRRFRNDIGERINMGDDLTLFVPDALADVAEEIVGTPKGLDTAEGNVNPQYKRHKVVSVLRLDDNSTVNWYMAWESQMKKDLIWLERVKPETKVWIDEETMLTKVSIYFRNAYGWLDWRWFYGHNVS